MGTALFLSGSAVSLAQTAPVTPVPPIPQFQKNVPEGRECSVRMQYVALEKALAQGRKVVIGSAYPIERTIAVKGGRMSIGARLSDRRETREYLVDGYLLRWDSEYGIAYEPADGDNSQDFKAAFPELDWATSEHFAGKQMVEGAQFLVWRQKDGPQLRRLLVDPETLLPVRYEENGLIYRYSYRPISKELAELPPELAAEWRRISGARR